MQKALVLIISAGMAIISISSYASDSLPALSIKVELLQSSPAVVLSVTIENTSDEVLYLLNSYPGIGYKNKACHFLATTQSGYSKQQDTCYNSSIIPLGPHSNIALLWRLPIASLFEPESAYCDHGAISCCIVYLKENPDEVESLTEKYVFFHQKWVESKELQF